MSRLIDLTGQVFGKLTVLKRGPNTSKGRNRVQWHCKCDCGNNTLVLRTNLKSGNVKSCGCLNKLKNGEANFNVLYSNYKRNAKNRGYSFNLTKAQFKKITKQNCFYCGIEPKMEKINNKRNNGKYLYNGVDRVDNKKGYSVDNCVAACKECNLGKGKKHIKEFLNWIKRVSSNMENISYEKYE